jgi:hypothetical protein
MIDVIVVVRAISKVAPVTEVTRVSIKIVVEVAEEENRREAHVKR